MSRVTSTFGPKVSTPNTVNRDNFAAFTQSDKESYVQMLMTNTLGSTFYATKNDLLKEAEAMHIKVTTASPRFASKALVYARENGYMRTQPIFGLAVLSETSHSEFNRVFSRVVKTPNDLFDFVAIVKSRRGGEGGRSIKTAVNNWFKSTLNEYWAIKYGSEKEGEYSLKDIIKTFHPKFGQPNDIVAYLLGHAYDVTKTPQIYNFLKLKEAKTDYDKIKYIREGRLPHEVATTFAGNSKEVWSAIVPNMPIFALLRNLATLERHGIINDFKDLITKKFTNPELIAQSMILPYRYLDAEAKVTTPWVKDLLRGAVEMSFNALPEIHGATAIALDTSGSMQGQFLKIASIYGIALAKKTDYLSKFYTFSNDTKEVYVSKHDSVLTQAGKIVAMGGTNTGSVVTKMTKDNFKADNLILITDEQQNIAVPAYGNWSSSNGSFYNNVVQYKSKVNPRLKTFIVDVAPYTGSQLTPSESDVYYIYGWSDKVLEFISLASLGFNTITKLIEENNDL